MVLALELFSIIITITSEDSGTRIKIKKKSQKQIRRSLIRNHWLKEMMERRRTALVLLVVVVVLTWQKGSLGKWADTTAKDARNAAETAKKMATETAQDAKDKTASWAGWVSDKVTT